MRLDKYLKVSRLIKRRTVAKEVCDAGRIQINGRPAKAGTNVEVGDKISVSYGGRLREAEVLIVAETMRADQSDTMYRILSEKRLADSGEGREEDF